MRAAHLVSDEDAERTAAKTSGENVDKIQLSLGGRDGCGDECAVTWTNYPNTSNRRQREEAEIGEDFLERVSVNVPCFRVGSMGHAACARSSATPKCRVTTGGANGRNFEYYQAHGGTADEVLGS